MATITLNYDARNATVRQLVEGLLSSGLFRLEKSKKMSEIEMALKEVKEGKINTYNSVDDLLKKINS